MSGKQSGKKAMPTLVKAQQERYVAKLRRAHEVSKALKAQDPTAIPFSETHNPVTGEVHPDSTLSARVSRVNTWLKNNDREYWNAHFRCAPTPPKGGKSSPPKRGKGGANSKVAMTPLPKAGDLKGKGKLVEGESSKQALPSPRIIDYWVSYPSDSKIDLYKADDPAKPAATIVQVLYDDNLRPNQSGDILLQLSLEVDVLGGLTSADKGRVSTLPKGGNHDVGRFLGSDNYATLSAGCNMINFVSKSGGEVKDAETLLKGSVPCVYRVDAQAQFFVRKWAKYRTIVPQIKPGTTGKTVTLTL